SDAAIVHAQVTGTGDPRQVFLLDIVEHVHHGVAELDIVDGLSRKDAIHCGAENFPSLLAPHVVGNQESAAQEEFAQASDFGIPTAQPAGLRGADPGMVPDPVVAKPEMTRLADLNASEAAYAHGEVVVGIRPIDDPPPGTLRPTGGEPEASMKARIVVVFEA